MGTTNDFLHLCSKLNLRAHLIYARNPRMQAASQKKKQMNLFCSSLGLHYIRGVIGQPNTGHLEKLLNVIRITTSK